MKTLIKFIFFSSLAMLTANFQNVEGAAQNKEELEIAIVQLVSHPSLNDIHQGIVDQLQASGYQEGVNLSINQQNAEGDMSLLQTISDQVVNDQPDLIFAITTPVAQTFQEKTQEIPIILAGITDPLTAGLVDNLDRPGQNISGVSDQVPLEEHFQLMKEIQPEIKKLGIIYSTSDESGRSDAEKAKEVAQSLGLKVELEGVAQAIDVQMVGLQLAGQVDAIYVGADNTVASAFEALLDVTEDSGIGIYPSIDMMVSQGGVAALAINQAEIGHEAALVAIKILEGQKIGDIPISYVKTKYKVYNAKTVEKLDITIPKYLLKSLNEIGGE
ncbi:ABC transporter substrate-binding protein [Facklamia sp. DSM 111018]|uniref:ABC transporter substrate-binding protein n=1 Tax=Facklamia lactis TaxID=2749967 RepID=A0ABS0LPQ0_9LACT|nr:ABC transporter substrate-binding protein [Facklamia lactis]MBG9979969.1 ABC transporter substrate-binding protein [Facklamia lactis]MBG9985351.1 ABC transporter substrate-binding protein [Facklamia lactis]